MVDTKIIAKIPLFAGLSKKDLKRLAGDFREETYRAEREIVTQGEQTGALFVIVKGTAKVIINGRTRRRFGAGDVFGEISVLANTPRTATVQAENDVTVYRMTSTSFLAAVGDHPTIAKKVMITLATRIAELDKTI